MIRKYHNHKLQTNPWYREEEPHNNHETSRRQTKQSNQLFYLAIFFKTVRGPLQNYIDQTFTIYFKREYFTRSYGIHRKLWKALKSAEVPKRFYLQ